MRKVRLGYRERKREREKETEIEKEREIDSEKKCVVKEFDENRTRNVQSLLNFFDSLLLISLQITFFLFRQSLARLRGGNLRSLGSLLVQGGKTVNFLALRMLSGVIPSEDVVTNEVGHKHVVRV